LNVGGQGRFPKRQPRVRMIAFSIQVASRPKAANMHRPSGTNTQRSAALKLVACPLISSALIITQAKMGAAMAKTSR